MCTGLALSPRQWTDRAELAQEPQGRKKVSAQNHIHMEAQGWPDETCSWLTRAIEGGGFSNRNQQTQGRECQALCPLQGSRVVIPGLQNRRPTGWSSPRMTENKTPLAVTGERAVQSTEASSPRHTSTQLRKSSPLL